MAPKINPFDPAAVVVCGQKRFQGREAVSWNIPQLNLTLDGGAWAPFQPNITWPLPGLAGTAGGVEHVVEGVSGRSISFNEGNRNQPGQRSQ